MNNVFVATKKI